MFADSSVDNQRHRDTAVFEIDFIGRLRQITRFLTGHDKPIDFAIGRFEELDEASVKALRRYGPLDSFAVGRLAIPMRSDFASLFSSESISFFNSAGVAFKKSAWASLISPLSLRHCLSLSKVILGRDRARLTELEYCSTESDSVASNGALFQPKSEPTNLHARKTVLVSL